MSQIEKSCPEYSNFERIGSGTFGNIYKAQNKETKYYVAIKEIDKERYDNSTNEESEIMNKIKTENSVSVIETIDTKEYYYIVMELCDCNLEEYILKREKKLSIKEIREVLTQLNNTFKIMQKENIIHRDLKPSNILISFNRLDKCLIKLSDYGSSKELNKTLKTLSYKGTTLTMSPEMLKGGTVNSKSDIWSLGIIIYFMLFKKYPYQGKNEIQLFDDIMSEKHLELIEDKNLNDLINKMLKTNVDERISWDDYFVHSFFKEDNNLISFKCSKHLNNYICYYCKTCKKNICLNCLEEHSSHEVISFSDIGVNEIEINKMEVLLKEINKKLNDFSQIKQNIEDFINKIKLIKENKSIYENDNNNNYKEYIINYIETIKNKVEFNEINFNNLLTKDIKNKDNYIICTYDIKEEKDDNLIQIFNSYEEFKRKYPNWHYGGLSKNEKEIEGNCELYINDKIDFCYNYQFPKEGKNTIQIYFQKPLSNLNLMFRECKNLITIDLSNFNANNVINMGDMFFYCTSLTSLNLNNFNTNNVINMNRMFSNCSSLTSLNLDNFNTDNVIDMNSMFYECSSLISLNLNNFNTNNVQDMSYMFYSCSSLTTLNLDNFNTNNVQDMSFMFSSCSSLTSLNLSKFNTNNVKDMGYMFSNCCSLTSLDLSTFNTDNVNNMNNMFFGCFHFTSLNLSNFNMTNVINMNDMFKELKKECEIITKDKIILDKINNIKV